MARRSSRQTRLPSEEPESALADRYANYRVLARTYLSATALSSFSYCNAKPFVERIVSALGLDTETPEMRAGARAHEALQAALLEAAPPSELSLRDALDRQVFAFAAEYPLKDEARSLRGIADLVFAKDGDAYIIELKNTRPPMRADPMWGVPVWYEHGLQLHFYGVLGRQSLGRTVHLALSYLKGAPNDVVVDELRRSGDPEQALLDLYATSTKAEASDAARAVVDATIDGFRRAEKGSIVPPPTHGDPRRCAGCRVRHWCPRRLDAPGQFERLRAQALPP